MVFDTSMYQNFRGGSFLSEIGQGIRKNRQEQLQREQMALRQQEAERQKQAFESEQADKERLRRQEVMNTVGQTANNLFSIKDPQAQQAEWMNVRQNLIQSGLAQPAQLPEDFRMAQPIVNFYHQKHKRARQAEDLGIEAKRLGIDKTRAEIGKLNAEAERAKNPQGQGPSVFNKSMLADLGKQASSWYSKDRGVLTTNLMKLNTAVNKLGQAVQSGRSLSGWGHNITPDWLRAITHEDALVARDSMHSAIQDTLRPTLGAQFTEKEGERIMNLAWNDKLSTEENLRRAVELQEIVQRKVEATDSLYQWIQSGKNPAEFPYHEFGMEMVASGGRTRRSGSSSFGLPSANATTGSNTNKPKWAK